MVNHNGRVVHVRQGLEARQRRLGWIMVARESELLPWPVAPLNAQSGPRRIVDDGED